MEIHFETALQLLISFVIGTAIGLEREYRSKAAGLRTMIMICIGSTVFTEISISIGESSPDRIASNIITGIGFLGAGVIFKDGLSINGITTATTIWIAAALGMAVGAGEYFIALAGSVVVLIVLSLFEHFQRIIVRTHQARSYKITFEEDETFVSLLEAEISKLKLRFHKARDIKNENDYTVVYEIFGGEKKLETFNLILKAMPQVKSYEY
ncbi:MgtC/SapB family protein [Chryseolinea sp. H1M3-3]|uniref:MgtC/SapB family protein n=1 Tax=Chryseolinea sp. H1M3-3 TaxID=3034144 RepID=UPI0023EBE61B|nr:MgtC/SapB family protein [Chryseolinea sp. H1M3-3]